MGDTNVEEAVTSDDEAEPGQPPVTTKKKAVQPQQATLVGEDEAARAYRYPQYKPDKYLISAAVPPPPFFVRRVGRMYVLREKIGKDGLPQFTCVVGPCWPMVCVTLTLIVGTSLAVFLGLMPGLPLWIIIPCSVLVVVNVAAFFKTACTDPGIQRVRDEPENSSWTFSEQAQTYRGPGAVYELEAQVVIQDIDHFCPWTGTVIAKRNMTAFKVFTSTLCFLILACMFVAGAAVYDRSN